MSMISFSAVKRRSLLEAHATGREESVANLNANERLDPGEGIGLVAYTTLFPQPFPNRESSILPK